MSPTGPAVLALLRAGEVAALLVLFGTFGFRALVLPRGAPGAADPAAFGRTLRRVELLAAALALGCGAGWFLDEAALLGGATGLGQAVVTVPAMLVYLGFARWLLARLGMLALILAGLLVTPARGLTGRRFAALFTLAAAALGVQPWLGHAGAAGGLAGAVLPGAELVHLAGAGLWLGGLPALLVVLRHAGDAETARALRRFSVVSLVAVGAIAAGGAAQGWLLVGGAARLSGTFYGRLVLLKTALFAAALALAAVNRFVLTPRVAAAPARRRLLRAVAIEAALGLAIVLVAGWLAGLPPGVDQGVVAARVWPWDLAGLIFLGFVLLALRLAWLPGRPLLPQRSDS